LRFGLKPGIQQSGLAAVAFAAATGLISRGNGGVVFLSFYAKIG
jgi:hypothetical protein